MGINSINNQLHNQPSDRSFAVRCTYQPCAQPSLTTSQHHTTKTPSRCSPRSQSLLSSPPLLHQHFQASLLGAVPATTLAAGAAVPSSPSVSLHTQRNT